MSDVRPAASQQPPTRKASIWRPVNTGRHDWQSYDSLGFVKGGLPVNELLELLSTAKSAFAVRTFDAIVCQFGISVSDDGCPNKTLQLAPGAIIRNPHTS